MHNITPELLSKALPKCKEPELWAPLMDHLFPKYGITDENAQEAFIAQTAHESVYFNVREENLYYSASALNKVFPKYFKRAGRDAKVYAKKPEAIANVVYGGRMGNNDSGDGYKFRGRGIIQLTGKDNYESFGKYIGIDDLDEVIAYLETPAGAMESAMWFWKSRGLNNYVHDYRALTKRINGGYNGMKDREKNLYNVKKAFSGKSTEKQPPRHHATVSMGDRGSDVKTLQRALGINPDGIFGPQTKREVKSFQMKNGLSPDGVVGPKTQSKLYK